MFGYTKKKILQLSSHFPYWKGTEKKQHHKSIKQCLSTPS